MQHDWQQQLASRLAPLRLRPEREMEIVDELSQHLDDQVRERVSGGADPDVAIREALAELDAPGVLAQRLRSLETSAPSSLPPGAPARGHWFAACWQDLRHACRSLLRTPAFTAAVVVTMALTIGPTTAMLSIGNWLVWRPVPSIVEPDRIAVVQFANWSKDGYSPTRNSPQNIADMLAASQTMQAIAGTQESAETIGVEGQLAENLPAAHADANFFETLGVRPVAGRFFDASEDLLPYGIAVAVLSEPFARRAFGTPETAIGKTILLNQHRLQVVGVAPASFRGISPFSAVEVWYPGAAYRPLHSFAATSLQNARGDGTFSQFLVRLKPDATFDALAAELDVLTPRLAERFPDENRKYTTVRARVFPGIGGDILSRDADRTLVQRLALICSALVVLGCANIANLLVFRSVRRAREQVVRLALGASRARLVQAQLIESCALTTGGALVGIAIAVPVQTLILSLALPRFVSSGVDVSVPIDTRVLLATLGVAVIAGISAGLLPAWINAHRHVVAGLSAASNRGSVRGRRVRSGFATVQLALSLAMLIGALLMVTSVRGLLASTLGFEPDGVSMHSVNLAGNGYKTPDALRYLRALGPALAAAPGIEAFSFSSGAPMATVMNLRVVAPNATSEAQLVVRGNTITRDYFAVAGIPVLQGRTFTVDEELALGDSAGDAVIVSASLAQRFFGSTDAVGRTFGIGTGKASRTVTIVGVAGDLRPTLGKGDTELTLYQPFARDEQIPYVTRPGVLVKSSLPLSQVAAIVKAASARADAKVPVYGSKPLGALIDSQMANQRLFAWILSLFGGLGFVLAAVGLYGLLAQTVTERTREFGIRIAIGATRRQVFALVLRYAMVIALIGGAAGIALALFGTRMIEAQLFGVTAHDPAVYGAATLALMIVVLLAAVWPARTATRVEPIVALRND